MQERILQTTDRLFYEQGIRAVGVDTVAAEVGISKRTLYNYYPSKDALIAAYLSRRFRPVPLTDRAAGRADSRQFRSARTLVRERSVPRLPVRECGRRAEGARARGQQDRDRLQGRAARLVPRTAGAARRGGSGRPRDAADAAGRMARSRRRSCAAIRRWRGAARAAAATLLTAAGVDVPGRAVPRATPAANAGVAGRSAAYASASTLRLAPFPRPLCDRMKSEMRGAISERKREPLNTP